MKTCILLPWEKREIVLLEDRFSGFSCIALINFTTSSEFKQEGQTEVKQKIVHKVKAALWRWGMTGTGELESRPTAAWMLREPSPLAECCKNGRGTGSHSCELWNHELQGFKGSRQRRWMEYIVYYYQRWCCPYKAFPLTYTSNSYEGCNACSQHNSRICYHKQLWAAVEYSDWTNKFGNPSHKALILGKKVYTLC